MTWLSQQKIFGFFWILCLTQQVNLVLPETHVPNSFGESLCNSSMSTCGLHMSMLVGGKFVNCGRYIQSLFCNILCQKSLLGYCLSVEFSLLKLRSNNSTGINLWCPEITPVLFFICLIVVFPFLILCHLSTF